MLESESHTVYFVESLHSAFHSSFALFRIPHANRSLFQAFLWRSFRRHPDGMAWTPEDAFQTKALLEKAGRNGLTPKPLWDCHQPPTMKSLRWSAT